MKQQDNNKIEQYKKVEIRRWESYNKIIKTEKQIFAEEFIMRKKLTAVLPAAVFAYALAGTTGIAQNVYAADEEETLTVWCWDPTFNVRCNEAG